MKHLFLISILLFPMVANAYMLLPITEVIDGDTIRTDMSTRLPNPLGKIKVRIRGIDTPEMPAKSYQTTGKLNKAKCVKEAELALEAREFVRMITVGFTKMKVDNFKWGTYGGRIIADVKIGGVDVGQALLDAGYAVPYDGKAAKSQDWCQ